MNMIVLLLLLKLPYSQIDLQEAQALPAPVCIEYCSVEVQ